MYYPSEKNKTLIKYMVKLEGLLSGITDVNKKDDLKSIPDLLWTWSIKYILIQVLLTAMYGLQPASSVLATESTRCPLIPKSHIFTSPFLLINMLLGLTSRWITFSLVFR